MSPGPELRRQRAAALRAEFEGDLCRPDGCGRRKQEMRTFCPRCFNSLPSPLRAGLFKRFGAGYERAYDEAVAYLRRNPRRDPKPRRELAE